MVLTQNQHLSQPKVDFVSLSNILLYILGDSGNAPKNFFFFIDVFPNQEERYMVAFKRDIRSMLFFVIHPTFMSNNINCSIVFCIHKMKCNVNINIGTLSNINLSLLFFPLHCLTFSRHLLLTHIKVFKTRC